MICFVTCMEIITNETTYVKTQQIYSKVHFTSHTRPHYCQTC